MANGKTFADMKKPVRQPTPEQIAAFEETGRASRVPDPQVGTETRKAVVPEARPADTEPAALLRKGVDMESRKPADTESRQHADTETSMTANPSSREHGNPPSRTSMDAETRIAKDTEPRQAVNTETRVFVRLTIDLDEPVHTRFKIACVMTRRKMVDEVRALIERRTADLEGEAGRVP